jgi:hypothetical protein
MPPAATPAWPTIPEPSCGAAISAPSWAARKAIVRPDRCAASMTAFQAAW